MDQEKLHLIANGIASIGDAVDENFWEILEALVDAKILNEGHRTEITHYMETL